MKILITTDCYIPTVNGVVTSIKNLKSELCKKGHDVRILCLSQDIHYSEDENIYRIGSFSVGKIYPDARISFHIPNILMKHIIEWKPDIIHSQCEFSSFLFARKIAKAVNCPIVQTYHTVYENYTHYFSPSKVIGKKVVSSLSRVLLNKTESVIAPTKKIKDLLNSYNVNKPINIIPTGIDINKFKIKLSDSEKLKLKFELGIPENNKILISLGRIAKEKNIEEILHYYKKLNLNNTTLLIVGDGPYKKELENLVSKLKISDKTIFTGMISSKEVAKYYQIGDIFLNASNSETQGLTYIEAMASGLPAVCRKDPCLDGVISNGKNGFQYVDYNTFSNSILSLINDNFLYNELSEQAIITANKYSSEVFGKNIEKIYIDTITQYKKEKRNKIEN